MVLQNIKERLSSKSIFFSEDSINNRPTVIGYEGAIRYCRELKSGKKWAGFSIPVTINSSTNQVYFFEKNPIWGRIYYPYFKKMINELT
jgi:hypothetical protein